MLGGFGALTINIYWLRYFFFFFFGCVTLIIILVHVGFEGIENKNRK